MVGTVRIAIDVMGGDHGPRAALPAALACLQRFPQLQLVLVGDPVAIAGELGTAEIDAHRLAVHAADDVVTMSDRPSHALRHKFRSSMRLALEQHAAGAVEGVVSAGNTGALMAMGMAVLKMLPGIVRPAICAVLPGRGSGCYLLDLGANVDCSALQLHQFATMGSALAAVLAGGERPRVGLLNIGAEAGKGNEQVKAAALLLGGDPTLNYIGFIEGDALFEGRADVVVCDGFAGNVALKVCEGTAGLIAGKVRAAFDRNAMTRLAALFARPILQGLQRELDPQRYNGACLLGLQGVVVKCHGNSTAAGFEQAIAVAVAAVERDLPGLIGARLPSETGLP